MTRTNIDIIFPIDVEQGEAGLFYITSPLVRGLLVTGRTENEALDKVQQALTDLAKANCLIVAAPDLLDSLQVTLRMLEAAHRQLGMWTKDNPRIAAAHTAIAKATGGEQV